MKKTFSKVAQHCPNFFFQYCQPAQIQHKYHILFHIDGSLRDFYKYIMTLIVHIIVHITIAQILRWCLNSSFFLTPVKKLVQRKLRLSTNILTNQNVALQSKHLAFNILVRTARKG